MLYDYINLNKALSESLYAQLYSNIKENIESGRLQSGCKLPSIRKLSSDLNISKTTVENAYSQLCAEGYIINKPQSGFYTASLLTNGLKDSTVAASISAEPAECIYKYDFTGKSVDIGNISLKLWKKYIRYILNCDYLITSYGNPQGEPQLRRALSEYSYSVRGVAADLNEIIIGAGTQPLLYLLCGLLREGYGCTIAIEEQGFAYAKRVFTDCNYNIASVNCENGGLNIEYLKETGARILLVNPSGNLLNGEPLKMSKRTALLNWAEENDAIIIEDDYNGELKYYSKPIPAMQSFNKDRVVYIGSFSKLLMPSVRIGYMTLPRQLLSIYNDNKLKYNQTASKMEQLALAKYISDGQMERSLRRLRKIYKEKSDFTLGLLRESPIKGTDFTLKETSLSINLHILKNIDFGKLHSELKENSVNVIFQENNYTSFDISFSGIEKERIKEGLLIIKKIIEGL